MAISLKNFFFRLLIPLCALFSLEKLQRYDTPFRAQKMSRLIHNGCNIAGDKMIWFVKYILSMPYQVEFQ